METRIQLLAIIASGILLLIVLELVRRLRSIYSRTCWPIPGSIKTISNANKASSSKR